MKVENLEVIAVSYNRNSSEGTTRTNESGARAETTNTHADRQNHSFGVLSNSTAGSGTGSRTNLSTNAQSKLQAGSKPATAHPFCVLT